MIRNVRWRRAAAAAVLAAALAAAWAYHAWAAAPKRPPRPLPENVQKQSDVEYGKGGGRALRMDIFRPVAKPPKPMPVLVWIHGGAWRAGTKDSIPGLALQLAAEGWLCASIEYRLSQEAIFPAQIEDAKCAIRFLRAHAKEFQIDPDRIGVWGSSAGGHLVAMLGTTGDVKDLEGSGGWADQSSRVQAVVDFFGPSDLMQMGNGPRIRHMEEGSPESLLIGATVKDNPEKAARASPVTYVTKDDPPVLIMHGDQDDTVPIGQSELLHAALTKAGVASTFEVVKGRGHGFGGPAIDAAVRAFLEKHLKVE
jgi:acetyl esterase/lipase